MVELVVPLVKFTIVLFNIDNETLAVPELYIPATDWDGTNMTAWNGASYLFETALIDYTDPIK